MVQLASYSEIIWLFEEEWNADGAVNAERRLMIMGSAAQVLAKCTKLRVKQAAQQGEVMILAHQSVGLMKT